MDYGKRREWYLPLWEKHYLRKSTLTIKIHEHLKGSTEKREGRSEWIYEELDVGKWGWKEWSTVVQEMFYSEVSLYLTEGRLESEWVNVRCLETR